MNLHRLTLSVTIALVGFAALAQECGTGRYINPMFFAEVDTLTGIPFGSNTDLNGDPQTLYMDVYMPAGDVLAERPVVLVAFGGSFVTGSREDVGPFCDLLAHCGYVAVAMDYRVGFFLPNSTSTMRAVQRCVHDLKGCVRFLRRTVAEDGNPYAIDTGRIIIGGVSAGAIGALHATYMDRPEELPPALVQDSAAFGGIEGNSGSPGYSSDVIGCFSLSGAIKDTLMIEAGDQPLCSIHETGDPTVPCFTQEAEAFGFPTGVVVSGSGDIHRRAVSVGLQDCYLQYTSNDHVGYLSYDPVVSLNFVVQFLARLACNDDPIGCTDIVQGIPDPAGAVEALRLYPSPAMDRVTIELPERTVVVVTDMGGREVLRRTLPQGAAQLDVGALGQGLYVVRTTGMVPRIARLVKE